MRLGLLVFFFSALIAMKRSAEISEKVTTKRTKTENGNSKHEEEGKAPYLPSELFLQICFYTNFQSLLPLSLTCKGWHAALNTPGRLMDYWNIFLQTENIECFDNLAKVMIRELAGKFRSQAPRLLARLLPTLPLSLTSSRRLHMMMSYLGEEERWTFALCFFSKPKLARPLKNRQNMVTVEMPELLKAICQYSDSDEGDEENSSVAEDDEKEDSDDSSEEYLSYCDNMNPYIWYPSFYSEFAYVDTRIKPLLLAGPQPILATIMMTCGTRTFYDQPGYDLWADVFRHSGPGFRVRIAWVFETLVAAGMIFGVDQVNANKIQRLYTALEGHLPMITSLKNLVANLKEYSGKGSNMIESFYRIPLSDIVLNGMKSLLITADNLESGLQSLRSFPGFLRQRQRIIETLKMFRFEKVFKVACLEPWQKHLLKMLDYEQHKGCSKRCMDNLWKLIDEYDEATIQYVLKELLTFRLTPNIHPLIFDVIKLTDTLELKASIMTCFNSPNKVRLLVEILNQVGEFSEYLKVFLIMDIAAAQTDPELKRLYERASQNPDFYQIICELAAQMNRLADDPKFK